MHIGDTKTLAKINSGDELRLNLHSHRVSICTNEGKYLGRLPDDLSARLRKLAKYGNDYEVYVKSVNNSDVKVFIREVKRAKKLTDIPSFSTEKIDYISFTAPELVHKKGEIDVTVDMDEE